MLTTILAIDLGKYNSVLCWYEPATRSATFRSVKTTPARQHGEVSEASPVDGDGRRAGTRGGPTS